MRGKENSKAVKSPFKQDPRHNFRPFLLHLGHPALVDIVGPANQVVLVAAHRHLQPELRIWIRTGSEFNRVSGSGSVFGIRIRIQEGKNDPQKYKFFFNIMF
jgi:hypothetical protein